MIREGWEDFKREHPDHPVFWFVVYLVVGTVTLYMLMFLACL